MITCSVFKRLAMLVCMAGALYSCKKSPALKKDTNIISGTREELTKDSIFLYAKEIYYWYNALPSFSVFNPRKYNSASDQFENFEQELFAITQYAKNPLTNLPYEYVSATAGYPKYSYITDITKQNPVAFIKNKKSSVDLEGNGNDFGLMVVASGVSKQDFRIYVKAVYPGSPAEKAGIKRGDSFNKINGVAIGTNYDTQFDYIYTSIFESPAVTLEGNKRDNSSLNVALNKASYKSSPIYKDTIYSAGNKKIGYMAYARFSNPDDSYSEFNRVFNNFTTNKVTDLIIDLRYNGGGYVSSSEYLANLIAPRALSTANTVMFTEYFNTLMQQNYSKRNTSPTAPLLAKQYILNANDQKQDLNNDGKWDTYADEDFSASSQIARFSKRGSLEGIGKVVFIVSGSTASASELVINNLKPHMSVKVVGSQSYGKPIGFFPIRIDKYDVYFSMFQTKNSLGSGEYYNGISPDISISDDVRRDKCDMWVLGDGPMAAAYNYITSNTVSSLSSKQGFNTSAKASVVLETPGKSLSDFEFKGMIENRVKIK